jgi:hypothetical protein
MGVQWGEPVPSHLAQQQLLHLLWVTSYQLQVPRAASLPLLGHLFYPAPAMQAATGGPAEMQVPGR